MANNARERQRSNSCYCASGDRGGDRYGGGGGGGGGGSSYSSGGDEMQQQPDTIFVQNLPLDVSEQDLIQQFGSIGMIKVIRHDIIIIVICCLRVFWHMQAILLYASDEFKFDGASKKDCHSLTP